MTDETADAAKMKWSSVMNQGDNENKNDLRLTESVAEIHSLKKIKKI